MATFEQKSNNPQSRSDEKVNHFRKYSTSGIGQKREQTEIFKLPSISDIDISLIEKKQSRVSQAIKSKAGNSEGIFSPALTAIRSQSPIRPARQSPKSTQSQRTPQIRISQGRNKDRKQKILEQQQEYENEKDWSLEPNQSINWRSLWLYAKLILFSYEFNLIEYLTNIDEQTTKTVLDLLKVAPGYKCIQYVYMFYFLKYGFVIGLIAALLYPLPYSILFLMITVDLQVPFVAIFMLAGMRSGALALLLKYCLHFPKHNFHWIVLLFTVVIGIILPNNYLFILLFLISIFLSLYIRHSESRPSISESQDLQRQEAANLQMSAFGFNFSQQQIYKEYNVIDKLPETYSNLSIALIIVAALVLWVLQRYFQDRQLEIFGQILPIGMLISSKQMLAFFPYMYNQNIESSTLSSNTLISLSFLFPGPHSKAFMFFIVHTQITNVIIGYMILYLPPILLANIFVGYRPYFFTPTYYNIRQSIQAVGNGIVFCLVYQMLSQEPCFFKSICYSAVVIMVVAKLYKLRELFAITLGIFLISARTIVLNVNKDIPFEEQACLFVNSTLTT